MKMEIIKRISLVLRKKCHEQIRISDFNSHFMHIFLIYFVSLHLKWDYFYKYLLSHQISVGENELQHYALK